MPSSSFQCQPPNIQHSGRPMPASLDSCPRSMFPMWGLSMRPPDAPGRTADYLTPGGSSEEGIIEPRDGQPSVYRRARSHPGTSPSFRSRSARRPSSSFTALRPSLSSSDISLFPPPTSVAFPEQPMSHPSAYVPDYGNFSYPFNFGVLDPTAGAFDHNFAGFSDGMQAAWEQHHQSVLVTSPQAFPIGQQTLNHAHDHLMGDASPFQLNFGDSAEWQTPNTSPYYTLTPYSASSPSTSSPGYIDSPFYTGQDFQQGPNGI